MSTERSDNVYNLYLGASDKFDYFVVSLSFALVGYLGSQHNPVALGWNSSTLELASLLVLLLSAVAGLKRIEVGVMFLGITHRRLYEEECAGAMASAAMSGGPALNESTGQIMAPIDMIKKAQAHRIGAKAVGEETDKAGMRGGFWYRLRDRLLILGLVLLILARFHTP